jgi:hypothetical protein
MEIRLRLPSIDEILNKGMPVEIAREGKSWSKKQLGEYANEQGVYVIHHAGSIKYIGRAVKHPGWKGSYGNFGERLRREFHETASRGRHIYPKLAKLDTKEHEIKVTLFPLHEIKKIVLDEGLGEGLDDRGRAAILEQALIHVYRPEFQESEWK